MFRNFLYTVSAVTVISLGAVFSHSYAGPQTNPWGSGQAEQAQEDVLESPAHMDNPAQSAHKHDGAHAVADKAAKEKAPAASDAAQPAPAADKKQVADNASNAPEGKKPPDIDKDTKTEPVPPNKKLVGRVVWVKGGELTAQQGEEAPRVLKKHSNVYLHDTLKTKERTTAQLIFTDDSSVTFRANTEFKVTDYEYVPEKERKKDEKASGKYVMDLVTGGFRTVTGLVAKENPDDYKVVTPVATIGVRGTEYSVVYEVGKELYIKRYEGDPCVTGEGEDQKTLCLDEKVEYGVVEGKGEPAVALGEQPEVFSFDVQVTPVSFGQGGGYTPTDTDGLGGLGGGGFCIQ